MGHPHDGLVHPLRAALTGLIDYAGLFPPANLDLRHTIANFDRYASSGERWLLGRLIVPLGQLGNLARLVDQSHHDTPWTISLLVQANDPIDSIAARVVAFNARYAPSRTAIVAVESTAHRPDDVARFAAAVPSSIERYVEIPLDGDVPRLLDAIFVAGCYAKARTGGITADRIPSVRALACFLAASAGRDVPGKLTAGLHHPLRREHSVSTDDLVRTRTRLLRSIGSCSFEEPIADLKSLGWWIS